MKKQLSIIKDFSMITLATAIVAAGVFFFLMPSAISVGSISGLAIILGNFIPLQISTLTMILNVLLLIIGFLFIGKEFGAKTVYTSILLPFFIGVFEQAFPSFTSLTADPFLDMICYIFIVSIGLAMLFNRNASSGGLDIVAMLMGKYLHMDLGNAVSVAGMVIALSSVLVSDIKIVILGVLGTYLNGIVLDHFIFDFNPRRRVCIVSQKEEAIRHYILDELHSGATIYEAIGAYSLEPRREILAIVDKAEYTKLMTFIEKVDPDAFVTVYPVNKVMYKPKQIAK